MCYAFDYSVEMFKQEAARISGQPLKLQSSLSALPYEWNVIS